MSKKKTIISKIKEIFSDETLDETLKFVDVKTEDGTILRVSDMEVGASVTEVTEDGEKAVESGTFELEGGVTMIVEDGKISKIDKVDENADDSTESEDESMDEHEGMELKLEDGTAIHIETKVEGEISEGDEVHVYDENGDKKPLFEGEHLLDDGRVLVVDDKGYVVSVKDADTEEIVEDVVDEEEMSEIENIKVTNQLKDLISQIKELKNSFEDMKVENEELKSRFNKFASEPSEQPIKEKISFSTVSRDDKLKFFSKR
jgi:hypothetical protein